MRRYIKFYDCPDETTCDVVWLDRVTGQQILRYDGADPANTREEYGAVSDKECFERRGLDIKATVPEGTKIFTDEELVRKHEITLS